METANLLVHSLKGHEYAIILMSVFLDVLGIPGTSIPLLVMGGWLAASGEMSLFPLIVCATITASLGDAIWYAIGKNIVVKQRCSCFPKQLASVNTWGGAFGFLQNTAPPFC